MNGVFTERLLVEWDCGSDNNGWSHVAKGYILMHALVICRNSGCFLIVRGNFICLPSQDGRAARGEVAARARPILPAACIEHAFFAVRVSGGTASGKIRVRKWGLQSMGRQYPWGCFVRLSHANSRVEMSICFPVTVSGGKFLLKSETDTDSPSHFTVIYSDGLSILRILPPLRSPL